MICLFKKNFQKVFKGLSFFHHIYFTPLHYVSSTHFLYSRRLSFFHYDCSMSLQLTSNAIEIPSDPTPFNRPLGSFNEKARPIHPATGARVIYLLLNDAMIPVCKSVCEWVSVWVSVWVSESVRESVSEWVSECGSGSANVGKIS